MTTFNFSDKNTSLIHADEAIKKETVTCSVVSADVDIKTRVLELGIDVSQSVQFQSAAKDVEETDSGKTKLSIDFTQETSLLIYEDYMESALTHPEAVETETVMRTVLLEALEDQLEVLDQLHQFNVQAGLTDTQFTTMISSDIVPKAIKVEMPVKDILNLLDDPATTTSKTR